MGFLTKDEIEELMPAEMLPHTTPIPTQIVSSDEYYPPAQSAKQKEVEARLLALSDEAGWKQALVGKPQTLEDLKYNNYFKEVFLDSDTKVALISSSPSDIPQDWFLTNEMIIAARERVNR